MNYRSASWLLNAVCSALLLGLSCPVEAGTFSASTTAPVVDMGDVAYMYHLTNSTLKSYTDAGAVGTTFTVGSKPILVDAFSLLSSTATLGSRNNTYEIRVGTITSGTNFTEISSTSGILQTVDTVAPSWFTWTFDAPIALDANTTYAIDVRMTASGGWSSNIPYYYLDSTQSYADGQQYSCKNSPYDIAAFNSKDMVFHVNAEFPPPAGTIIMLK